MNKMKLLLVAVGFSLFLTACGDSDTGKAEVEKEESKEVVKTEPKEEPAETEADTESKFEAIKIGDSITGEGGMTYEEVREIITEEPFDHTTSEVASGDITIKTDMYTWVDGLGKGFSVVFTNDLASAKVEVGK